MFSFTDFIDSQKYFIKNQRKSIENITKFLDEFNKQSDKRLVNDSKRVENGFERTNGLQSKETTIRTSAQFNDNVPNIEMVDTIGFRKNNNRSSDGMMMRTDGLFWSEDDCKFAQKRRRLAAERKKEYNQYLKEKSKLELRPQIRIVQNGNRVQNRYSTQSYQNILEKKRIEEQKHREVNGINDIKELESDDEGSQKGYKLETVGFFHCSNNKFDPEYITPRSRLLATHSSRMRAAEYAEELRLQIEEKNKIKAEEKERIRREELEIERKINEQRFKMLKEFDEEHERPIKMLDEVRKHEEIGKRPTDIRQTSQPLSLLRSPSYVYSRDTQPLRSRNKKISRSLASSMKSSATQTRQTNHSITPQSIRKSNRVGKGVTRIASESPISASDESSDSDRQYIPKTPCSPSIHRTEDRVINYVPDEEPIEKSEPVSQLSEVRQMMQSEHIRMLEQLRQQQVEQMLANQTI